MKPRTSKTPTKTPRRAGITEGSGNVFADLGVPHPERELAKAHLTLQIHRIIKQRGMTQTEAANALGIRQPQVSLLMNNRAGSFSVGKLLEFLTALGQDIEIKVRPTARPQGEMSVTLGLTRARSHTGSKFR
jgi:predicted XRE-type DNA-binding protein